MTGFPSRAAGFGAQPELKIMIVVVVAVVLTIGAIAIDDKSPTLWDSIVRYGLPLLMLGALVAIPFALAAGWDWLQEFRKWSMGPPSALRELRRWYYAPAERRASPLAALAALEDLRVDHAVDGETALHWALNMAVQIQLGEDLDPVVERLLAAGADPNARDRRGNSPLHVAAVANTPRRVIERLLAAGADPSIEAALGQTPLQIARLWDPGGETAALLEAAAHAPRKPS